MSHYVYRLKIAEQDYEVLRQLVLADMPLEAGAFALAGVYETDRGADILVRRTLSVPRGLFRLQNEARLEIAPQAINGLAALCTRNGLGAVVCHSHPSNSPYSSSDDYGEKRVFETLRQFVPSNAPMASLLVYPNGIRGRVWTADAPLPVPIDEILIVGRHLRKIYPELSHAQPKSNPELYDRQVRAFGTYGQAQIEQSRIGIVGVGGTGSATAEQLARLGVGDFVLIDPDNWEASNITRMYGTFASMLRRLPWPFRMRLPLKAHLVAAHLKKINPKVRIRAVPKSVVLQEAAIQLLDRDVIFLCTDEHWGRSIVNQLAYQYMIPTINLGSRVTAKDGTILGAVGIVDVLRPGLPCLWCKQFLRADRIAAESMPRSAREALEQEGYVEGVDTPAPAVVSINTAVSGLGVTLLLQLLTDFMGANGSIARLNYDVMDGTVRRGMATIPSKCICTKVRGFGDLKALPTLTDV